MIVSIASAEVLGVRIALQLPPCGTPGRILKTRLHRHFRRRDGVPGNCARKASTWSAATAPAAVLDRSQPLIYDRPSTAAFQLDGDTALLLRQLYRQSSALASASSGRDALAFDVASRDSQPPPLDALSYYPIPGESYQTLRHKFLRLLQAQQPRALLSFLAAALGSHSSSLHGPSTTYSKHVVTQLLADLPDATFSELLRTLDPVATAESSESELLTEETSGETLTNGPNPGSLQTRGGYDRRRSRTRPLGQAGYALDATAGLSLDASLPLLHHPLAAAVDDFGVRTVYRVLLEVALEALQARGVGISSRDGRPRALKQTRSSGSSWSGSTDVSLLQRLVSTDVTRARPSLADAKILLRIAGASQTPQLVSAVWNRLVRPVGSGAGGPGPDAAAYAEYVAARFLTRPLYYQHDRTRVMMGPRQLWRQLSDVERDGGEGGRVGGSPGWCKVVHHQRAVRDRRGLSLWGTALWSDSSGERGLATAAGGHETNVTGESAWPVTWEPDPDKVKAELASLLDDAAAKGQVSEELLCALMVAETRVGGTEMIERIMQEYWNIAVTFDAAGNVRVEVADEDGALGFESDSPLRPTEHLLEALVEAFCRRSEVANAITVAGFVSNTYGIPMPPKIWHSLLEWSWVLSTSSSWRRLGHKAKVVPPESIRWIWETMRSHLGEETADPATILPADELQILARHLAKFGTGTVQGRSELFAVLDAMVLQNDAQRREAVELTEDLKQAVRAGIDVAPLVTRQQKALADFYITAWWIRKACRLVLANTASNEATLAAATGGFVPTLVARYRKYLNTQLTYKVATGRVWLRDGEDDELPVGYFAGEVADDDEPRFRQFVHWSPLGPDAAKGAVPAAIVEPGSTHLLSARSGEVPRRMHQLEERTRLMEKMKFYGL